MSMGMEQGWGWERNRHGMGMGRDRLGSVSLPSHAKGIFLG